MKKSALLLIAIALPLACNKEVQAPEETTPAQAEQTASEAKIMEVTLTAVNESAATKTFFNKSTGAITWTASESNLAIFDGSAKQSFTHVETLEDGAKATFSGSADVSAPTWTAVHPATHAALEGGNIFVTFPCIQEARPAGGLKADINTSAAIVTHDGSGNIDDFTMKNIGGLLKLTVAKAGIKTITVSSVGGEALTGKAQLSFDGSGNPVVTPVATQFETFVTLKAANLAEGLATGEYFVSVFPVSMASGLIIDMENIDGTIASVKSSTTATVARSADLEFAGFDTVASWYEPEETTMTLNFKNTTWPFKETTATGGTDDDATKWKGNTEKQLTYTPDNSILFYIKCSDYCSANGANGLRFGKGNGDYLMFPAIQGKNLIQVKVKYVASKTDKTRPAILTRGGNDVVIGGDAVGSDIVSGNVGTETVETWDLTGTAHNMQYRYQLTFGGNDVTYIDQIELTYASKKTNLVLDVNFWTDNGSANGAINQPFKDYTIPSVKTTQNRACTFEYQGVDYSFEIGGGYRILASESNRGLGLTSNGGQLGYIKVPAISGYKLIAMSAVSGGPATDGAIGTGRFDFNTTAEKNDSFKITTVASTMAEPATFSATFDSTEENTAYYFVAAWGWQTLKNLHLVYTPVSSPSPAPAQPSGTPALLLDGGEFIL